MAISSSDISPVPPGSSSSKKLKQKNLMHLKNKKKLGPTNKRLKRSTRVKLTPNNKTLQEAVDETRKKATAKTRKRKMKQSYSQADMNSPTLLRAKEVQSKLSQMYPSFVKSMLKSHVYRGFWLGLPKPFCNEHMPMQDELFLLVCEDVEEEEVHWAKYLGLKSGLSGGWRGFAIAHKLDAGDVLVFQLIESRKFKVYIVRATESERAEMDLNSQPKTTDYISHSEEECEDVKNMTDSEPAATEQANGDSLDSEPSATSQETENDSDYEPEPAASLQETGKGSDVETVATLQQTKKSNDVECIGLSKSLLESKDVMVDGRNLKPDIPDHLLCGYYELCANQKNILHVDLVKGLNFKLAAGIISETVIMADKIKAAKLTSASLERLQSWDKTLKAFEEMGMRVGFLRTRLSKLIRLLYQQEMIRIKKVEQARLEVEIQDLEGKLSKRCEEKNTLDAEIEGLLVKESGAEISFKNIAAAAW